MLAVTPNDDLDRLASLEFSHDFGRANVYQLATKGERASERRQTSMAHIQGRKLFVHPPSTSPASQVDSRMEQPSNKHALHRRSRLRIFLTAMASRRGLCLLSRRHEN